MVRKKAKGGKPDNPRNRVTGRWEGAGATRRHLMRLLPSTLKPTQRRWLAAFLATGNLREACRIAGFSWSSHYSWLRSDPAYSKAYEEAKELVADAAEDCLHARGVDGYDKPLVYKGKITAWYKEFSDVCLVTWLKANKPTKFRDSLVNLTSNSPAIINISLGSIPDKPAQPAIEGPDGGDGPIDVVPHVSMG